MNKLEIIIWGNDNYHTLGLVRELHHEDVKVLFILNKNKAYCASLSVYCPEVYVQSSYSDGLAYLINKYKGYKQRPVIIATNDLVSEFIDEHQDELKPYFVISGTRQKGNLKNITDKYKMCKLASECNIMVPRSILFTKKSVVETSFTYPVILKPTKKSLLNSNIFKTKKIDDSIALKEFQESLTGDEEFILQDYIDKEKDILVYGYRTTRGNFVIGGSFVKDRWTSIGDGSHGVIRSEIPDCIDVNAIEKFINKIQYSGLFSVEYGLKKGEAYFYEFNLRNDGTSYYFYQAGINLPLMWASEECDIELNTRKCIRTPQLFIDEVDDYDNVSSGDINKETWKRDLAEAKLFRYYDAKDKKPYYFALLKSRLRPFYQKIKAFLK